TVLELSGRIGFAVDVRDFLELERAFERDRVVETTAEKERVLLLRELLRPGDDGWLEREHRLDRGRKVSQPRDPASFLFRAEPPTELGQRERQQEQRDELRRERLGRCNADLRTGPREKREPGLTHHRARWYVADRQRMPVSERAGVLERGQRIGRLARLR